MQHAPEQMVVDGGYISSNNIAEMAKRGIDFVGPESENKAAEANRRKSYKHHGVSAEYEASKFIFDTKTNTYVCPQGKHLRYDAKQESHGAMRYRYKASSRTATRVRPKISAVLVRSMAARSSGANSCPT